MIIGYKITNKITKRINIINDQCFWISFSNLFFAKLKGLEINCLHNQSRMSFISTLPLCLVDTTLITSKESTICLGFYSLIYFF